MAFVTALAPTAPLRSPIRTCAHARLRVSAFVARRTRVAQHPVGARAARRATVTMNISSNDFRNGTTIEMDGVPYRVVEFLHVKPGKGAAFVRTKLKNMRSGGNVDKTFKAGEMVSSANMEKVTAQHTYMDGDEFVFMNTETFEEERLSLTALGPDVAKFLKVGQDVEMLKYGEEVLDINLPKSIPFEVTETEPGAKGNTAQGNALKRAVIETGAEVMVPLFINQGESIKINFPEGTYGGRSND